MPNCVDFLDPDCRKIGGKKFDKIPALGLEGWLWNEVYHHAATLYSVT